MSDESTRVLAELDAAIGSVGISVRAESLEQAWNLTVETPPSDRFNETVHRALDQAIPAGELMLLVTLRARRGREPELLRAAEAFVGASRQLPGMRASILYRSAADPQTLTLVERFAGRQVLEQHMASEYFRRFQVSQAPLLAAPVEAVFYQRSVSGHQTPDPTLGI
jgi:quinol monooxygenase YgiN